MIFTNLHETEAVLFTLSVRVNVAANSPSHTDRAVELLQNVLQPHSQATPLWSMRAVSQASSQH